MDVKPGHVDLLKLAKAVNVEINSFEPLTERESRLRREEADAAQQRKQDLVLFDAATAGVAGVAIHCGCLAVAPGSSADEKKWATAVLASIGSESLGVMVGKNSK